MRSKKIAFSKHTPSLFIIVSPFQLLCAIEAIKEFCISEYDFILALDRGNPRNQQMLSMMNELHLDYDLIYVDAISYSEFKNNSGLFSKRPKKQYRRIFIGEYYSYKIKIYATLFAKKDSVVVYTDDGNASLSLFNGISRDLNPPKTFVDKYSARKLELKQFLRYKWVCFQKGIINRNYFFTVYHDIPSWRFTMYPNHLSHLMPQESCNTLDKTIIFIGTVVDHYCRQMSIDVSWFESRLRNVLKNIRQNYPDYNILYIPHGRDTNTVIPVICNDYGVKYQRINVAIEYYLLQQRLKPQVVIGVNSTALYNIKKMLPIVRIINIYIENKYAVFRDFFKEVALYYSKHSIEIMKIDYIPEE